MRRIHILSLIVISIILTPWIKISGNLPEVRPEWLITLVGLGIFPVLASAAQSRVFVWWVFVMSSSIVSMAFGHLFLRIAVIPQDIFTIISPGIFLSFFLLAASDTYSMTQYRSFLRVTLVALGVSAVIAVIQFFDPDIVLPIVKLWADEGRIFEYTLFRATGTMGNPNDQGFLMVVGFTLAIFTQRHNVSPFLLRWGLIILFFAAVFATGSRTSMICVMTVIIFFTLIESRLKLKALAFIAIIMAGIYWFFNEIIVHSILFRGLHFQVTSFERLDTDASWQSRVLGALETLPMIAENLILGQGPAKQSFETGANIDNEYILILYRFGLLGLIATAGFVWTLAMQLPKLQATGSPLLLSMRRFSIASVVAAALFAYTAGIFTSFRLLGLLIVLWTVTAGVFIAPHKNFSV